MSLRFQKRINLGRGSGLNIGKTGISFSQRTKYGSFGSRGFSVRTGIPGLTFRQTWGKKGGGFVILLIIGLFAAVWWVLYNTIRLCIFMVSQLYGLVKARV